jgi:hypothetical protein
MGAPKNGVDFGMPKIHAVKKLHHLRKKAELKVDFCAILFVRLPFRDWQARNYSKSRQETFQ